MGCATDSTCTRNPKKRKNKDPYNQQGPQPSLRYCNQGGIFFFLITKFNLGGRYEGRNLWAQAEISLIHVKSMYQKMEGSKAR